METKDTLETVRSDRAKHVRDHSGTNGLRHHGHGMLRGIREAAGEQLIHIKDRAVDSARDAAKYVDHSAHKSPWYFVGGVAALTALAGYVLGSKTTKH
jgi:ElaB/YqjD/DUF883 family membrane-anchored ribosome-binding protein